jgi:hypothetical protein
MPTQSEATSSDHPSSQEQGPQVVVVGPFVGRPGRELVNDVIYSVTLPSGFVATGPSSFPDREAPPLVALDQHRYFTPD